MVFDYLVSPFPVLSFKRKLIRVLSLILEAWTILCLLLLGGWWKKVMLLDELTFDNTSNFRLYRYLSHWFSLFIVLPMRNVFVFGSVSLNFLSVVCWFFEIKNSPTSQIAISLRLPLDIEKKKWVTAINAKNMPKLTRSDMWSSVVYCTQWWSMIFCMILVFSSFIYSFMKKVMILSENCSSIFRSFYFYFYFYHLVVFFSCIYSFMNRLMISAEMKFF